MKTNNVDLIICSATT